MRLAIDANALVSELLRVRGRALIRRADLMLFVSARAWSEAEHELLRRAELVARRLGLTPEDAAESVRTGIDTAVAHVRVVPTRMCDPFETEARLRIPRDPEDWPAVAAALALDCSIWTNDHDFLGCGVATWTTETLLLKFGL